nr:type II toxin-antitoxin system PemK/MazF family toxin [Brooklawnia cerclae]
MDRTRPVVVLTREAARAAMTKVTVAPITSTVKGLNSEVPVEAVNGLDRAMLAESVESLLPDGGSTTLRQAQGSFRQAQGSFRQAQGSFRQAQGSFRQAQGSFRQGQGSFRQA